MKTIDRNYLEKQLDLLNKDLEKLKNKSDIESVFLKQKIQTDINNIKKMIKK